MPEPHHVAVSRQSGVIGERWRWDCSCGRGAYGYTSEEAAQQYADEHPEKAARVDAMWAER